MRESELHEPVTQWLTAQGYRVSAEVRHCDLVAQMAGEEPVVVELKTRMSLELIIQGVRRQEVSPSVYLGVPLHGARATLPNQRGVRTLLRRLGLGLLVVRYLRHGTRVEVLLHPVSPHESPPRRRHAQRRALLREIDGRYLELNRGGQASTDTQWSAFRQRSLVVAALMAREPERVWAPREIRAVGGPEQTGTILSANHLGWFDRVARGAYRISDAGMSVVTAHYERAQQLIRHATS